MSKKQSNFSELLTTVLALIAAIGLAVLAFNTVFSLEKTNYDKYQYELIVVLKDLKFHSLGISDRKHCQELTDFWLQDKDLHRVLCVYRGELK